MPQYRQGHILLNPTRKVLTGLTRVQSPDPNHVVIAHGESGREHVFKGGNIEIYQDGSELYFKVTGDGILLDHPEHGGIDVDPGTYQVIDQREDEGQQQRPRRSFD